MVKAQKVMENWEKTVGKTQKWY